MEPIDTQCCKKSSDNHHSTVRFKINVLNQVLRKVGVLLDP